MAFPATPLNVKVEVALGADLTANPSTWLWTNVTSYVRAEAGIRINHGGYDGAVQIPPSTIEFTADNRDGRWCEYNPTGAWFGQLSRGTPIRVKAGSIDDVSDTFTRSVSSAWGSATTGQAWTCSGGSVADFSVTGTAGLQSVGSVNVRRISQLDTTVKDFDITVDVSVNVTSAATQPVTAWIGGRGTDTSNFMVARLDLDTAGATTLFIGKVVAGAVTTLSSVASVGSGHVSGEVWRVRFYGNGNIYKAKAWIPASASEPNWQVTAVDNTFLTGSLVFLCSRLTTGNTNTLPVVFTWDNLTIDSTDVRMTGFIVSLPPRWDLSENNKYVLVTAAGTTRRLQRGRSPLRSALVRSISKLGDKPKAYWPCEDASGATSFAEFSGGPAMTFLHTLALADDGPAGSLPLPQLVDLGTVGGYVPDHPVTGQWTVMMVANIAVAVPSRTVIMRWKTTGSLPIWQLVLDAGSPDTIALEAYDSSGTIQVNNISQFVGGDIIEPYDQWITFFVTAAQSGGNIDYTSNVVLGSSASGATGSVAATPGVVTHVGNPPSANLATSHVGHFAVWDDVLTFGVDIDYRAIGGFVGEQSSARLSRVGGEESVFVYTAAGGIQTMGAQSVASLYDTLQECVTVSAGRLFDFRDPTLVDIPLRAILADDLVNQGVALALDHSSGHLAPGFEPVSDDQYLRNDWTASQPNGSSGRVVAKTGNLTPAKVGTYDDSVIANTETPAGLLDQAGWRVSLGTIEGLRFPQATLDFARNSSLIETWTTLEIGSRISISNPPAGMPPDSIDMLLEGWTEYFNNYAWTTTLNCSPYQPYHVGELATASGDTNPDLGWLDWDACEVSAAVNSSATSWTVNAFPTDTTTADDFPRDVYCEGELVTCTASATAVADTFARTVSNGWGTADTAQSWATSGGSASDFSVSAGDGWQLHSAVNTLKGNVIAVGAGARDQRVRVTAINPFGAATGAAITQWVCPRWTDSSNYYVARLELSGSDIQLSLLKRVAGVLTVLVSPITIGSNHVGNDEWIIDTQVFGSSLSAKAWKIGAPEPSTWLVSITDTSLTVGTSLGLLTRFETGNTNTLPNSLRWDDLDVVSARTWTVTRSVNGVSKSHGANADVTLAHPIVLAL